LTPTIATSRWPDVGVVGKVAESDETGEGPDPADALCTRATEAWRQTP
jgi:hypothetical protein